MTKVGRIGLVAIALALTGIMVFAGAFAAFSGQNVAQAQGAATATPTTAASPTTSASPTVSATGSPTTGPSATTTPATTTSTIGNTFWQGLAAKLGISVDTLKAQAVQERKDMIDQAVKDGRLTQDQANQIKQQITADNLIAPINIGPAGGQPGNGQPGNGQPGIGPRGNGRGFGPRGFGRGNQGNPPGRGFGNGGFYGGFGFGGGSTAQLEAVAKALNMNPSDLVSQLYAGKTLADVATAQKVDQNTVKQAIINTRSAEIDREVTDGLLTQAQANGLKANWTPDKIDLTRIRFFGR